MSSHRAEFSKKTKRQALERSQLKCEAIGALYGLESGVKCGVSLAYGVEFDHIVLAANGGDNSLENCAAVCIKCHRFKTERHDIPMAAKTVRMQDKARGIAAPKPKIASRGFPKTAKPPRPKKQELPRRPIYQEIAE